MEDSGYPSSSIGSYASQQQSATSIFPGKLKKVLLKNFMCHDHFEIEFNPCVNFIHGRNGSGKSAIATAIVLGFGQRATSTNRGVAVKSFIKRGRRMATIEITLHNAGSGNPYKQAHFGNEITIIRKITENGGSQYKICGASGPEENLARSDLDSLLLHFNIQPQNPLCILSQDTARSFFKSRDPKQMYQLFMRGTQMETIRESYQKNVQHTIRLLKECEKSEQELVKMNQDVIEADKKQEIAFKLKDTQEKKKHLENELAWTRSKLWEAKVEENENSLQKAIEDKEEFEKSEENRGGSEKSLLDKRGEFENELLELQRGMENLDIEMKSNSETIHRCQDQLKYKDQCIEKGKVKVTSLDENINELEAAIQKIQSKHAQSQEYHKKLMEVAQKIEETEAAIKTTETYQGQLKHTDSEFCGQMDRINNEIKNNEFKRRDLQLKLNQLREGNSLGVYGHWMPKLVEKIKNAYERGMFRQMPRGPIGAYVQVSDEPWVPAIESILKPMLSMFCVSCQEDNKVLNNIIDQVIDRRGSAKAPGIIISKFIFKVHDYQRYEVKTNRYRSMISCLKISDPIVANCLIDQTGIEQILLVPQLEDALRLMEMEQNAPANCKFTLTLQGDLIYPAPNYRFYTGNMNRRVELLQTDVSQQIREVENKLEMLRREHVKLNQDKQKILKELQGVQVDLQQQNVELKKLFAKKRSFDAEKLELERNFQFEPQSIEMYKDEIKELSLKKETILKEIEVIEKDRNELNVKYNENRRKRNDLLAKQKEFNEKINSIKTEITSIEKRIRERHRRKDEFKRKLAENNDCIERLQKELEEYKKKYQHFKSIVETENIEPMKIIRNVETIKKELNSVDASIKVFVQELGSSVELANENLHCKKRLYENKKASIKQLKMCIQRSGKVLESDNKSYEKIKNHQTRLAMMTFTNLLKVRNLEGKLAFDFEEKKLHIDVKPNVKGSSNEHSSALSSLSGGERSYATTAFIRAIWSSMTSPFYVLDEFDVFTDLSNRTQIIQLLIDHAKDNLHCQYLFITPLDLSHIITDEMVVVHVIRNPRDDN